MRSSQPKTLITVFAVGIGFLILSLGVCLAPRNGHDVAVLVAPLSDSHSQRTAAIVSKADGRFVDAAWSGRIVIARSDSPDFVSRLYAGGAFLVFNPNILAGCQ